MPHKDPVARKEYLKRYYQQNKERYEKYKINQDRQARSEYNKRYHANPLRKKKYRVRNLLKLYNLTSDQVEKYLFNQNGLCALCKKIDIRDRFVVDHDHKCCPDKGMSCGKCVRGLLCGLCNGGLGFFKDNIEVLYNAIAYLTCAERKHCQPN